MQEKIALACEKCGSRNYSTANHKQSQTERLEIKKYCKNCNAHTIHRETK
jgi:large subunit ribosomal protein L33